MVRTFRRLSPIFLLAAGCASAPQAPNGASRYGNLGWLACPAGDHLVIHRVWPGLGPDKAGLRPGDAVTGFEGESLSTPESRQNLLALASQRAGHRIQLDLARNGKPFRADVDVEVSSDQLFSVKQALRGEILSGKPISVGVVVEQVSNSLTGFSKWDGAASWKEGVTRNLIADFESPLAAVDCSNFTLVDRTTLDKALKELSLQSTGAVDNRSAKELGKLVGASHLVLLTFSRFPAVDGKGFQDDTSVRFLEVESGRVLGAGRFEKRTARPPKRP